MGQFGIEVGWIASIWVGGSIELRFGYLHREAFFAQVPDTPSLLVADTKHSRNSQMIDTFTWKCCQWSRSWSCALKCIDISISWFKSK